MTSNNLVPVFSGQLQDKNIQLCNARDLHAFLDVGRDFSNWIRERIAEYGFVAGEDYFSPNLANIQKGRGRPATEYHITLDMAKELGMIEKTAKGRAIRKYFIACEKGQAPTMSPVSKHKQLANKPLETFFAALRIYTKGLPNKGAMFIGLSELVFRRLDIKNLAGITDENVDAAVKIIADDMLDGQFGLYLSARYTLPGGENSLRSVKN